MTLNCLYFCYCIGVIPTVRISTVSGKAAAQFGFSSCLNYRNSNKIYYELDCVDLRSIEACGVVLVCKGEGHSFGNVSGFRIHRYYFTINEEKTENRNKTLRRKNFELS